MQAQIQALLAGRAGRVGEETQREERRGEGGVEVAKPQIFDGTPAKVGGSSQYVSFILG